MKAKEWKWALSIAVIVLLAFIFPYTFLDNVSKWYGSFFVWTLLSIIVIVINYFLTRNWGNER